MNRHYSNHLAHKFHSVIYERKFVHVWMGVRGDKSIKAQIFAQTDKEGEKLILLCHNSDLESEHLDYVIA